METIAAIYENGVFKPLRQVDLPEGTAVRVEAEDPKAGLVADLRKQLLTDGATPEEATRIIDNFRLLWDSYDTLTNEQKKQLEEARFDHVNCFNRQPAPDRL
jgi:predicted DNA-binding antitoxin AbrB/MazE fold protein